MPAKTNEKEQQEKTKEVLKRSRTRTLKLSKPDEGQEENQRALSP